MMDTVISPGQRRLVEVLKRLGTATAGELADRLEMTDVGVRQHLGALEAKGLVQPLATSGPRRRGRPSKKWSLTSAASGIFPDAHAELTTGFIRAIRDTVGEEGLLRVVASRARDQLAFYRTLAPPPDAPLATRVEALARQRTTEGYMAEVIEEEAGSFLLIEHHCPICAAARTCSRLCEAELDVFRGVLGPEVVVERIEHLLSEGERCVYRIQPAG